MRFGSAVSVMKLEKGINLFDKKGKLVSHLDIGRQPLHFDSSELFITSSLDGDLFGEKPFTSARPKTTVYGQLKPRNLNLTCFADKSFLGEVTKVSFHFAEGDEYHLMIRVWPAESGIDETNALHITAHLPRDMFREVFHPIWVRQTQARLSVTINVMGYQEGVEAAFGEIGDTENIIVEASADIDGKLAAIHLTSQLQ